MRGANDQMARGDARCDASMVGWPEALCPASAVVLRAWHVSHSACRLRSSSVPPRCRGTMWSTSYAEESTPIRRHAQHRPASRYSTRARIAIHALPRMRGLGATARRCESMRTDGRSMVTMSASPTNEKPAEVSQGGLRSDCQEYSTHVPMPHKSVRSNNSRNPASALRSSACA